MSSQTSPVTIFHRSLDRFKIGLSDREMEDFELTSLDEVHNVVLEIQKEHASERRMQNMTRIESFLEGMEQYGSVVEVFLNTSSFLAFVWGPIKFLLQVAKTWTESLSLLLDAYEEIGETIPQLLQYDKLFTQNPAMQRVLGLIYQDILEFHRRALVVFKRKSWKHLFHSTWKNFNAHFNRLVLNLKRHKLDIEREVSLIEVERNQVQREIQEKQFQNAEKLEREKEAISVIEKISPANFDLDQENISKNWSKEPQFGLWLLKDDKMVAWLDSKDLDADVLWLKGIPGAGKIDLAHRRRFKSAELILEAGKSVLISRIIAETRPIKPLIFFYCKYEDRNQSSLRAVLKAFLAQLIRINPDILSYIHEEVSTSSELTLETIEFLKKLVGYALESSDPIWIAIDGLDECDKKEKKKIMSWLLDNLEVEGCPGRIRLLVVSQDDGDIRKFLAKRPMMSLSNSSQHQEAIRAYASRKSNKLKTKLELSTSIERNIIELVTERSKGMFLFARLVLKHLKSQVTLEQLEQEMSPRYFPTELHDIYDRIISKIHSNGAQQCQAAERILAWIVRCKRPLKWHEVQFIFAIDLHNKVVDFPGRRLRGVDIKDLCGSLVEMSSSGAIELVHHTARSYLLDQSRPKMEPRVNIRATDLEIATTCLQYLCFRCFNGHLTDEEIVSYAWQGYYSFQDFATAYWLEYLWECFDSETRSDLEALKRLSLLIDNFMNFHSWGQGVREITNTASTASESEQMDRTISHIKDLQKVWKAHTTTENTSAEQDLSYFREQLNRRRSIFEKIIVELSSNDPKRIELSTFYGDPGGWFKCPRIQCFAFHEGFASPAMKEAHGKKHQRAFRCPLEACHYSVIGFSSAGELKRHRSKNHATPIEKREAAIPQSIIPGVEKDSSLAHSELNGKIPMASSIWYRDENALKDDDPESVFFYDIMTRGERPLKPNTNSPGGDDIIAWERRLGVKDDWVALFDPTSPIRLNVELDYTFQHTSVVCCVSFSKDGRYLATGCDNTCQIFDVASGKVLCISEYSYPTSGAENYCRCVCFSPNGRWLVSGWEEKVSIEIRSIDDEGLCAVTKQLIGHEEVVYSIDVSNDNALIASCSGDKTVKIWDFPMGLCLNTLKTETGLTCVGITPDSRLVVATSLDKCAYIWDIATGQQIASLKGHTDSVYGFEFIERGTHIVTAALDNAIMIWDIEKYGKANNELHEYPLSAGQSIAPCKTLLGHSDFVFYVTAICDDRLVLSASKDLCVRLWDPKTGKCNMILKGHKNSVICIAADPTGRTFATASGDMTMRLWRYEEINAVAQIRAK